MCIVCCPSLSISDLLTSVLLSGLRHPLNYTVCVFTMKHVFRGHLYTVKPVIRGHFYTVKPVFRGHLYTVKPVFRDTSIPVRETVSVGSLTWGS